MQLMPVLVMMCPDYLGDTDENKTKKKKECVQEEVNLYSHCVGTHGHWL